MLDTLGAVRNELIRSVDRLAPQQSFHVILFSQGTPQELRFRRLLPPTDDNKEELTSFLRDACPMGRTDVIPALVRAFETFDQNSQPSAGCICLLTDGYFPDNQKVRETVRRYNATRKIAISTFLCISTIPPFEPREKQLAEAEAFLKTLAQENGGKYLQIKLPWER